MKDGKSQYRNVSNDHGVLVEFLDGKWTMRNGSGVAAVSDFGAEEQTPPIGLKNHWKTSDGKGIFIMKETNYNEIEALLFGPRDADERRTLFQVYKFCLQHAPYSSKQKASGKKRCKKQEVAKINILRDPAEICCFVQPVTVRLQLESVGDVFSREPAKICLSEMQTQFEV